MRVGGGISARGKYKLKLFLNDCGMNLTFTRDYFAGEKLKKVLNFQRVRIPLLGLLSKNRSSDM